MCALREWGVGVSAVAALQCSCLAGLHCTDVALKQYKQEEHLKTENVPDFGSKKPGKRCDLTIGGSV